MDVKIVFAGYTDYFLWLEHPNLARALRRKAEQGCKIRFLVGDPDGEVTRRREEAENVPLTVSTRVRITLSEIEQVRGVPGIEARFGDEHIAMSVFRFDSEMPVTPYLVKLVGHDSPMLHLRRRQDDWISEPSWRESVGSARRGGSGMTAQPQDVVPSPWPMPEKNPRAIRAALVVPQDREAFDAGPKAVLDEVRVSLDLGALNTFVHRWWISACDSARDLEGRRRMRATAEQVLAGGPTDPVNDATTSTKGEAPSPVPPAPPERGTPAPPTAPPHTGPWRTRTGRCR